MDSLTERKLHRERERDYRLGSGKREREEKNKVWGWYLLNKMEREISLDMWTVVILSLFFYVSRSFQMLTGVRGWQLLRTAWARRLERRRNRRPHSEQAN